MEEFDQKIFLGLLAKQDNQAYKWLYSRYFIALKNLAGRYVKDADEASDIVQDTFFSLLSTGKKFESTDQVKYYLYAALKNKCISHLRKLQVRQAAVEMLPLYLDLLDDYWEQVLEEDVSSRLMAAVETLPPQCKLVMQLSLQGLKIADIALQMQISTETVKDHKANGRKKLTQWFKDRHMLILIHFLFG